MATELGKAYVQIIPSARGISGSIHNIFEPEFKGAGEKGASQLGGAFKKVLKVAGFVGIGKVVGQTFAKSLSEGANLQQSLGGIETMFGNHAGIVIDQAKNAYKTVGVSANKYMEQVTSFSASLLQSLGGDTKEATNISNMAMIDMSDKQTVRLKRIEPYQGCAYINKKSVCANGGTLNHLKVA